MIFKYRKKHLIVGFIIGALYTIAGILGIFFSSGVHYLFTAVGLWYVGSTFYKLKFQYLKLEDGILTCFVPGAKKRLDLEEVTRIIKFTDEITFLTPHEKLKISTRLIAKEDLPALKDVLASLDLEAEKNPFTVAVKD